MTESAVINQILVFVKSVFTLQKKCKIYFYKNNTKELPEYDFGKRSSRVTFFL